jgi:hypothetical protein
MTITLRTTHLVHDLDKGITLSSTALAFAIYHGYSACPRAAYLEACAKGLDQFLSAVGLV